MNKHESGYTLIGVLAIFTIASILALSLITLSMNTLSASKTEVDNQAVFYIAEAGLNHAVNELEKEADKISKDVSSEEMFLSALNGYLSGIEANANNLNFEQVNKSSPETTINIQKDKQVEGKYNITSTGKIDKQSRKVEQEVEIGWKGGVINKESEGSGNWRDFEDFGVYSFGNMTLDDGRYKKKVGSSSTAKESIHLQNQVNLSPENTIYLPEEKGQIKDNINFNVEKLDKVLQRPPLPEFPNGQEDKWVDGKICSQYLDNLSGKRYIKIVGISEIPYHCVLTLTNAQPNAELNIFIDPAEKEGNKSLLIRALNTEFTGWNKASINFYVNGNVEFPDRSTGGNIHASIYAKNDIIIRAGSSGVNFHGSLLSKGNIVLEKGASASEFYGELVYAENDVSFNSPDVIMHGTSVIGNDVNLKNTTINAKSHDSQVSSGSLSLKELEKLNSSNEENNPGTENESNLDNEVTFTTGPLHEIE